MLVMAPEIVHLGTFLAHVEAAYYRSFDAYVKYTEAWRRRGTGLDRCHRCQTGAKQVPKQVPCLKKQVPTVY